MSDNNAYAEALFRTAKYRPEFPVKGFPDLETHAFGRLSSCIGTTMSIVTAAFAMCHRRSAMMDVTMPFLQRAPTVYTQARTRNPKRWSRHTRNWTPVTTVTLNPEHDSVVQAALHTNQCRLAA